MPKTEILEIISSCNIGGAETMLLDLLESVNRDLFSPTVCVIGESPLTREVEKRGCRAVQLPPFEGKKDLPFLLRLIRTVHRLKPDVIQSHLLFTHFYSCLAGAVLRVPVIATFHSNDVLETTAGRMMAKMICRLSRKIVAVSRYQLGHFGLKNSSTKVEVIPNGTKMADVSPEGLPQLRISKRRELGFGEEDGVITCVGNLRPVKGHIHLLQAMRQVLRENPTAQLLIVGDGFLRDELVKTCEEYNMAGNVRFLGFRSDVTGLLAASDVFVNPSLSEANSIAIMEAMALGKPVVATDVGGNYELISDGATGLLVPPKAPAEMADRIVMLLKDKGLADRLGSAARSRIREDFRVEQMTGRYEQLFRKTAKNRTSFRSSGGRK